MVLHTFELLMVTMVVSIPNLALIGLYIFGGGELPQAVVQQSTSDNTYVYIACVPKSTDYNNFIVAIFIAYNELIILICATILLLSRNLKTAYNESEFLFLAVLQLAVTSVQPFLVAGYSNFECHHDSFILYCR